MAGVPKGSDRAISTQPLNCILTILYTPFRDTASFASKARPKGPASRFSADCQCRPLSSIHLNKTFLNSDPGKACQTAFCVFFFPPIFRPPDSSLTGSSKPTVTDDRPLGRGLTTLACRVPANLVWHVLCFGFSKQIHTADRRKKFDRVDHGKRRER